MIYVVCKPVYGPEDRDHGRCKRELEKRGPMIIELENCPYIDMARAALVEMAFEREPLFDVMVWIDHDILFEAADVWELAARCQNSHYGIVGVMYSMRRPRHTVIGQPAAHVDTANIYQDDLIDANFVGMGMTAVKRYVYEDMQKSLPLLECPTVGRKVRPYFAHQRKKGHYLGEDISFCNRAKKLGHEIGIFTKPRIFHRGQYDYALEDTGLCVPDLKDFIMRFDRHSVRVEISDITNQTPLLEGETQAAQ